MIDDWACKRGHRYGTIVCDLERRRIVDILPDREAATVEAWFSARPEIGVVSRDRGSAYGQAVARALPKATQVADRWHLMENASSAFLDAVRKSMRSIRQALGAGEVNPTLLTCAERLQYEGFLRQDETNTAIGALADQGTPIKENRPPHRLQPTSGSPARTRGEKRHVPRPDELARAMARPVGRGVDRRLPKWCRTLATSQDRRLQGQLARRRGMDGTTRTSRGGAVRENAHHHAWSHEW
jgi:hypothetical protein